MSSISDKLQALSMVSAKLNNATDELNELIERVEDDVRRSGVGLTVWLIPGENWSDTENDSVPDYQIAASDVRRARESDETGDDVTDIVDYWALGFTKIGDSWRIAAKRMENLIGHDIDRDRETGDPVPLVSAPRHVRMEAAQHLEMLVELLTVRAQRLLIDIERAKQLASK